MFLEAETFPSSRNGYSRSHLFAGLKEMVRRGLNVRTLRNQKQISTGSAKLQFVFKKNPGRGIN